MIIDKIKDIIKPTLDDMQVDIVSISMSTRERRGELEILIDKLDGTPVSIDLCSDVSRAVSALLDVEDIIDKRYNLIVSSAGINRPLNKLSDFQRFVNENVEVNTRIAVDNRRNFNGKIISVKDNDIVIKCDGNDYTISYDNIFKARLDKIKDLFKKAK